MSESSSPAGGMRRKPRQARSQERVNRILDVAEGLFASQGYAATTTNAIAAQAQVPIGSLYQFFPDKTAILQALSLRYAEMLHQELVFIDKAETVTLPLADYVNQLIDTTDRFFTDNPSYYAIFMEVQGTIRELDEIDEATDAKLIQDLASSLANRDARLEHADYEAIAFVLVKAIGTLLWLSLSQEPLYRQRLVAETKRLSLHYLQSYFSSELIPANNPAGAD
ncbi:TetR family transcriptional regulator [Anabaena cylindrica FACHB-243]|uniref:Regulatory protein TetR n=1 Tax=Anabaena cylindrica (strain ATCC 27899 / PCC 7122) TaxID=272123 RepID=K9ZDM7_ANACC|nr:MULTISPECIES: TetR family transcriptional regulator [Anabaena]AFZ57276.1 regulatory protein TetR [Anabaena cylindrica PCC 7122]MBD2420946.1 TetR family transcriptional regulator [Anabaena cylindrica FACHB-243]MBY5283453.1 TetR/AcrR family transcriptional regulator [Anabaena sp. CCAP 1446/1C]MBY5307022.1 TetR/AcrR family transcriptional regulator [Anabaena sp. CCAP 1446/1C]MCM2405699.1 TetR/AcrR family transcriptional regulator [Anabaena sp. CCAP 1446/1C]